MKALQSAALIALAHLAKLFTGIIFIKVISIYLGPEGVGKLGHLISFIAILYVFSGGGIQNGIVKFTAEYKQKPKALYNFLIEASQYTFFVTFIISVVLIIFSEKISFFLFEDKSLYWVIIWLSMLQILMSISKMILGVANGFKNTFVFSSSFFLGYTLSIPIIWLLVKNMGFLGAILSVSVSYLLISIILFYHFYHSTFSNRLSKRLLVLKRQGRLYKFSLMTLASSLSIPFVEIFIRQMIIEENGFYDAGLWQATNKLSAAYMGFFALYLAYYMVPTLSPRESIKEISSILFKNIILVSLLFLIFASLFYILKEPLITYLLSEDFLAVNPLIHYLLIGDFFKIIAFAIAFLYVSKSIAWAFILMEVVQGVFLYSITYLHFLNNKTLLSVFEAYTYSNILSLIFSVILLYFVLRKPLSGAHS